MAKGYEKKGRSGGFGGMAYTPGPDAVLAKKLGEIVSDLYMSTNESDIRRLWTSAHRLLLKSKADPQRVETVIKQKRIGALSTLTIELETGSNPSLRSSSATAAAEQVVGAAPAPSSPAPVTDAAPTTAPASTSPEPAPSGPASEPSADQLKHAMKAFRKRLKLTRLDDESRLGKRAMSGGKQSAVVAIMPPREYPAAVWQELVKQGRLRNAGNGFLELVGE